MEKLHNQGLEPADELEKVKEHPAVRESVDQISAEVTDIEQRSERIVQEVLQDNSPDVQGINVKISKLLQGFKDKLMIFGKIAVLSTLLYSAANYKEGVPEGEDWITMRDRAKAEMKEKGITSEQSMAYELGLNNLVYRGISPMTDSSTYYSMAQGLSFQKLQNAFETFAVNIIKGRTELNSFYEDTWRIYLGIPQKNDTLSISDYRPSKSQDNVYYYKFNDVEKALLVGVGYRLSDIITTLSENNGSLEKYSARSPALGKYSWQLGKDEKGSYVSYYDRWDLDIPLEKEKGLIGKPYEIYDRIYFDPVSLEVIK